MAVYTHNATDVPSGLPWLDVLPTSISWASTPVSFSSTLIVLANSDGTQTRITGVGLSITPDGLPSGGTVTSVQRVNPMALFPPYERIDGPGFASLNFPFALIGNNTSQIFANLFQAADTMNGHAGTDFLLGSPGTDTLNGGDGFDYADYWHSFTATGITASLADPTANTGDAAGDVYSSIEGIRGTDFADTITGDGATNVLFGKGGNDTVTGGAGDDTLDGGAGADTLNGGDGIDTVSYATATAGITARLDLAFGQESGSVFDTYNNIENVTGSDFADVIVGTAGLVNILRGGAGDDTIIGEGIDVVDGGSGSDTFFGGQGSALNINLATTSIETVWGSFVGDVMNGSTATANLTMVGQGLAGGANADTMTGGSGNDFIYFRAGDVINGGTGNDWAVATLSASGVTLNMTSTGFENAWGSTSGDLIVAGGSAPVVIVGDAGDDMLAGGSSGDFLYGLGDNDTLAGGGGNDNLIGGLGTDTFAFGLNWGTDIVWDWANGSEKFDLRGSGAHAFADLTVNQNYLGSGNALISFGSNRALVVGGANQIDESDFVFDFFDFASLVSPSSISSAGQVTEPIFGNVFEPGLTALPGAAAGVVAQLGYGPSGTDPAIGLNWNWIDATFNVQNGNNDEYQAVIPGLSPGAYSYTYRFGLSVGGNPPTAWTYADLDGSTNGFSTTQLGTLVEL